MGALNSLRPAVRGLVSNPIILVVTGLYGIVQLPQIAYRPQNPLVALGISLGVTGLVIVLLPFFQGGLIGMAREAIKGSTSIDTLVREGRSNYVTLLLAYLLILGINIVFGAIAIILVAFLGISLLAGEGELRLAAIVIPGIIGLVLALAYIVFVFIIQFYAHAIVLDGTGVVDGFKRSAGLVRQHLLSVIGYTAILTVGGVFFGLISTGLSFILSPQPPPGLTLPNLSPSLLIIAGVFFVGLTAIVGGLYATYSVAFYFGLRGEVNTDTA